MGWRRRKRARPGRGLRGRSLAGVTRFDDLRKEAKSRRGYGISRWSPGDGKTRYRFHAPGRPIDFFEDDGICTVLGLKPAKKFLETGSCPRSRKRRS
jgi:hypothetical protein